MFPKIIIKLILIKFTGMYVAENKVSVKNSVKNNYAQENISHILKTLYMFNKIVIYVYTTAHFVLC